MKTRESCIDVLRCLATIAVVFYHCGPDSSSGILPYQLIELLLNWCVPIFLMITGFLFLGDDRELTIKEITQRTVRFLMIIIVWGMVYNLISLTIINGFSFRTVIKSIIMTICADTTYAYQFWYLYLLVGLYLILPVVKPWVIKILAKEKPGLEIKWYFIFILIVAIIIPNIFAITNYTGSFWKGAFSVYSGFGFYLLCGAYLRRWRLLSTERIFLLISVIGIASFIIYNFLNETPENNTGLYGYTTYFTWAVSMLLFDTVRRIDLEKYNTKINSFFRVLSKYSLGIYILHPMVLQVLRKLGFGYESMNPWLFPLLIVPLTVVACIIISYCIKHIKLIKNLV